tara:strand:- start:23855 stop:24427 length:573 start_codon:yes stop_codon:yes gene_type:complete
MSCTISKGRGHFCLGQVGGIKQIFLANWYDANKITSVTADADTGIVSGLTTASALDFFQFDLDRQTSSFNQTITTGGGGAINYEQALDVHMSHDSQESWARMQNVVESVFQVIILDNNGVYYLAGVDNGVKVTGGSYAHGGDVAFTDYVGYILQMIGSEPFPAYNLSTANPFTAFTEISLSASVYNTPQV